MPKCVKKIINDNKLADTAYIGGSYDIDDYIIEVKHLFIYLFFLL